jgi:epoxyqueuosine reductase
MFSTQAQHTKLIRAEAQRLGFGFVGFAKAEQMTEEARRLENWLNGNNQGKMSYLERHFDLRTDPRKLVEGAKTVICLTFNYYNPTPQQDPDAPKLAMYAYGEDYHFVVKERLRELIFFIEQQIGAVNGRAFVDSAPVLERDWARRTGIGWVGKNTMLINPKGGSYFFLAELILDLPLVYDDPIKDFCGTCRRCIEACPTDAFSPEGYVMDASRCISYLTIELRDEKLPPQYQNKMDGWMFGCDICQQVCPWNRFSKPHNEPKFEPHEDLLTLKKSDWQDLTHEVFQKIFKKSAVKRTKYEGLLRNIKFLE